VEKSGVNQVLQKGIDARNRTEIEQTLQQSRKLNIKNEVTAAAEALLEVMIQVLCNGIRTRD
jgi:hypothetical protein